MPFRLGAFRTASAANARILPVSCGGSPTDAGSARDVLQCMHVVRSGHSGHLPRRYEPLARRRGEAVDPRSPGVGTTAQGVHGAPWLRYRDARYAGRSAHLPRYVCELRGRVGGARRGVLDGRRLRSGRGVDNSLD
ncbi:hypothetical protein WME90_32880 [Sorangium sp. So ce375]|uniref:hypothetical protein n=1 Tax=Sorangium sp. So ce375 TaxID=3133306 RepID=UPI003F5C5C23